MPENFLTEKAGPLPVWAWGVGLGVVAAVVVWWSGRGSSSTSSSSSDDVGPTTDPDTWQYATTGTMPGGGGGGTDSAIIPDVDTDTNFAWAARGVAWLIAQRLGGALEAQRAIALYLEGQPLDVEQRRMISAWIAEAGVPPDGTYGVSPDAPTAPATPAPAPAPAPAKPAPATPIDYGTRLVASIPSSVTEGKSFNVRLTVSAVDPRAGVPTGKLELRRGSKTLFSKRAVNGTTAGETSLKDKSGIAYLSARFVPSGKWKASAVGSTPVTVKKGKGK